jgi:hypothetical protein
MSPHRPHTPRVRPGALLAQEACAYQAASALLLDLRGELLVLIHGDVDCVNVLPQTLARSHGLAERFFSTNLSDADLSSGASEQRLREALLLLAREKAPRLLIVLTTCSTVLIGDDVAGIVDAASGETGIPMVAVKTHGLRPRSPAEIIDQVYALLVQGAAPSDRDRARRLNLVGFRMTAREHAELTAGLQAQGLTIHATLNDRATLDDFGAAGGAAWNVMPGPDQLLDFQARARARLDQGHVEIPLPFGLTATDTFYARITGELLGRAPAGFEEARARAVAATEAFRARHAADAPRLAFNLGSLATYDLRRLAQEGLAELPLFEELGFEITLLVQGPADDANQARVGRALATLGVDHPYVVFPDPGRLAALPELMGAALFFGARLLRQQVDTAGVPFIDCRAAEIEMGYEGVALSVARVEAALAEGGRR